jgi:outer membrane protein, heavy metal efflux system
MKASVCFVLGGLLMLSTRPDLAQTSEAQQEKMPPKPAAPPNVGPVSNTPPNVPDFSIDLSALTPPPFKAGHGIGAPSSKWTVAPSTPATEELTYEAFIREVVEANLDYAAQQFNVDIAQAQLAAAKLLPNPSLGLDGTRDLTFHNRHGSGTDDKPALLRQVESRSIGITQTVELGGKRKWRTRVADQNYRAAAATVDDFLRNLKIDASEAFAEALRTQNVVDQLRVAAGYLSDLTKAQEARFRSGDIGAADLTQTRLEELQFRNDLNQAESDAEQARLTLCTFLGRNRGQTSFVPRGRLQQDVRKYDLPFLINQALRERPDLVALRHTRDAAESNISLAKTEKIPDVDVGINYTQNGQVVANHPVDPTPAFHQLELSFSIPIPIFNRGQHDVAIAKAQARQADAQLQAAEMKAEVAIRAAHEAYQSSLARLAAFKTDLLKSTNTLLEARRYSYQRGASSLLELLEAQRSANEIQQEYQEALADAAKALLELERVTNVGAVSF